MQYTLKDYFVHKRFITLYRQLLFYSVILLTRSMTFVADREREHGDQVGTEKSAKRKRHSMEESSKSSKKRKR